MSIVTLSLSQLNLSGIFSATPSATLLDTNNKIVVQQAYTANIVSSTASLDIPPSYNQGVTYLFEAYKLNNVDTYYTQDGQVYTGAKFQHSDSNWYTGQAPLVAGVNKLLTKLTTQVRQNYIQSFYALMPATATDVKDLVDISVTDKQLEYSSYRVADLLSSVPLFKDRLPKGLTFLGTYDAATIYTKDQAVQYAGILWVYISNSNQSGITPGSNNAVWSIAVQPPSTNISSTNSIGWNRTNWLNDTFKSQAVSREDAVSLYDNIAQPDLSNVPRLNLDNTFTGLNLFPSIGATPNNNQAALVGWSDARFARFGSTNTFTATQTFLGGVIVQDRNAGDNTQNAANTKFVTSALSLFVPSRNATPIVDVARSTSQAIDITTNASTNGTVIIWNSFTNAGFFNTVGDFNVPSGTPTDTLFLFQGVLTFSVSGNFSSSGDRRFTCRIHVTVGAVDIGNAAMQTFNSFNGSSNYSMNFSRIFKLSANQSAQVRLHIFDNTSGTITAVTLSGSIANSFLNIYRCSA